jgi:hypothetical protein
MKNAPNKCRKNNNNAAKYIGRFNVSTVMGSRIPLKKMYRT